MFAFYDSIASAVNTASRFEKGFVCVFPVLYCVFPVLYCVFPVLYCVFPVPFFVFPVNILMRSRVCTMMLFGVSRVVSRIGRCLKADKLSLRTKVPNRKQPTMYQEYLSQKHPKIYTL